MTKRLFAAHLKSESCDNYYETFVAEREVTTADIEAWLQSNDQPYGDEAEYINVEEIWEVTEESAYKVK